LELQFIIDLLKFLLTVLIDEKMVCAMESIEYGYEARPPEIIRRPCFA